MVLLVRAGSLKQRLTADRADWRRALGSYGVALLGQGLELVNQTGPGTFPGVGSPEVVGIDRQGVTAYDAPTGFSGHIYVP